MLVTCIGLPTVTLFKVDVLPVCVSLKSCIADGLLSAPICPLDTVAPPPTLICLIADTLACEQMTARANISGIVNASVCQGNCTDQMFSLMPNTTYGVIVANGGGGNCEAAFGMTTYAENATGRLCKPVICVNSAYSLISGSSLAGACQQVLAIASPLGSGMGHCTDARSGQKVVSYIDILQCKESRRCMQS